MKSYKTKLNINSKKVLQAMKEMAGTYRKLFNASMDIQTYRVSHTHYSQEKLLSGTKVLEVLKVLKKSLYPFVGKMDKGIISAAAFEANRSFRRWYLTYSHASEYRFPKYKSKKKDNPSFKTDGNVKVFYDYITIPKLGKIKLYEKGYLPQGKRISNVTFSYDGNDWWISLDVEEQNSVPLNNSEVTLGINKDCELLVNGEITSTTFSKEYRRIEKKQKRLEKKLNRQSTLNMVTNGNVSKVRTSRNMMKTRKALKACKTRLNNIKTDSFKKIVNSVVRTKPKNLLLLSNERIIHSEKISIFKELNKIRTLELFGMIKKKMKSLGANISYATA